MPRIIGVDIPDNKKVFYALQSIFGVGPKRAEKVLRETNIDPDKRASELTNAEVNSIQRSLERYNLEGALRRIINENVDRLKRIKSYRGMRHSQNLPVRGQRTRTNARVARGSASRRRTVGSMSKEQATKMEESQKKKGKK